MYNSGRRGSSGGGGMAGIILLLVVIFGLYQQYKPIVPKDSNTGSSVEQVNKSDWWDEGTGQVKNQDSFDTNVDEGSQYQEELVMPPTVDDYISRDSQGSTDPVSEGVAVNRYLDYNGNPVIVESGTGLVFDGKISLHFSDLDELGRPGVAVATLSKDTIRSSKGRPSIKVDPVGYKQKQYVNAKGKKFWLYNRSHLIAYTFWNGEIDIAENLVTGTEYFNQVLMTEYEDLVRDTIKNGQKVMYRVTPNYRDRELLPRSLTMEMLSEDGSLNQTVTIFNIQDGISINYETGDSSQP